MARQNTIKLLRTSRSALTSQAGSSGLIAGEPYLVTDESRLAIATGTGTVASVVMQSDAASDSDARAMTATGKFVTPANLAARAIFRAHKNGSDQSSIGSATWTKLTFGSEAFDVGGYFDTTNARWTPPAGPVRLSAQAHLLSGTADDAYAQIAIYKNGSALATKVRVCKGTKDQSFDVTLNDVANGSDYYEVYVNFGGTGSKTVSGNSLWTFFCGEQV